jgi:predicted AlkP superfamily phosphohydrolase/phosphomutase
VRVTGGVREDSTQRRGDAKKNAENTINRGVSLLAVSLLLLGACSHPRATRAAGRKMIVLGLDGMDPNFLEAHWDVLPNLDRLRRTGDFKRLRTTVPPQSPVAWSTVTTGMDPGGHGVFDFVHRDPATRMPVFSMAETTPPKHTLGIGPYLIPLSSGSITSSRVGRTFWQVLEDHGIPSNVMRMPANFPPAECEADSLSGMGTPDMMGTSGTFTFFTDDPAETRTNVPGGKIVNVSLSNGRATLRIDGPPNSFRRDSATSSVEIAAHVDPTAQAARFDLGDQQVVLGRGEWSDWLRADFRLLPLVKSASGILRIYLQQAHPYLRVYVSPVNIDPASPALPISTPASFSRRLSDSLGLFYTQGIAEETSAYRAGLLNKDEFLVQSHKILSDSLRMFRYELAHFSDGLLFYYFSSTDQNAHMLWGKYDDDLLDVYRAVDGAVGEAMAKAGNDTTLLLLSDHGFARFDRAVHLNSWLMREGFLTLDDPANVGDEELFAHVDWSRTQAYAIGLNGLYLNRIGRENGGIVAESEVQQVKDMITRKLLEFRDPKDGQLVVGKLYDPLVVFQGRNLRVSPDLFVGYHRGFRGSWQTALGAVPKTLIDDNTQGWIADHCMASEEVPGVLLSNRKIRLEDPQLYDVTATILSEFGAPKDKGMLGQTVF